MKGSVQPAMRRNYRVPSPASTANGFSGDALPFKTVCANEVTLKPLNYLLKGLIAPGDFGVWFGPSGGGKTFAILDVAHAVATERSILGRRVRRAPVLLCALEGAVGFERRVFGIISERGPAPDLHIFSGALRLSPDDETVGRLIATARAVGAKMIVIDTLSRAMPGADENSAKDMTDMLAVVGRIISETGAAVLLVHHTGKDETKGSRGHSSLKAAADVEIEIKKHGAGGHVLKATKVKDGPCDVEYLFTLREVELGTDDDGDRITTCVVEEGGQRPAAAQTAKMTKGDLQALDWLREAVNEHGCTPPLSIPADIRATTKDKWTTIGHKRSDKSAEAIRKAIDRAITNLTVARLIGVSAPYFWVLK